MTIFLLNMFCIAQQDTITVRTDLYMHVLYIQHTPSTSEVKLNFDESAKYMFSKLCALRMGMLKRIAKIGCVDRTCTAALMHTFAVNAAPTFGLEIQKTHILEALVRMVCLSAVPHLIHQECLLYYNELTSMPLKTLVGALEITDTSIKYDTNNCVVYMPFQYALNLVGARLCNLRYLIFLFILIYFLFLTVFYRGGVAAVPFLFVITQLCYNLKSQLNAYMNCRHFQYHLTEFEGVKT